MLERERQFYNENISAWLQQHPGQFVLIKGEELAGIFNTMEEALAEGARRYGLAPFLLRRVEETREPVDVPALTLGILHADLAHSVRR